MWVAKSTFFQPSYRTWMKDTTLTLWGKLRGKDLGLTYQIKSLLTFEPVIRVTFTLTVVIWKKKKV